MNKCLLLWKVEGGHSGQQGYLLSTTYINFSSNNATSCLQHTHIAKPDLAPKLCLRTFINLTFCAGIYFKVLCKRTVDTYWETGYRRPCFFFLDNAITGSKCLKPANMSGDHAGYLYPFQKNVTIPGVLGDLINYHPLHSPYDTQYCAIFTERR